MLTLVVAATIITFILWQWYWRLQCLVPGSMGWPFIGETVPFLMNIRGFIRNRHAKFGPVFRTHLFGSPVVFLSAIPDAKTVLLGEGKIVVMQLIQPVHKLMEGSLLTQHGDTHKEHRRLFHHLTKPTVLKAITEIAMPLIRKEVETWPYHEAIDVKPRVRRIVFTLSQIAVFGCCDERFRQDIEPLFMTFNQGMFALPLDIPWTTFGRAMKARESLRRIIRNEICRRRKYGHGSGLLSVFLNEGLNDDDMISQTILATLAGFETTSFTICIAAHTLARNRDIVNRLRQEQEELGDTDYSALQRQILLNAAVKESMRLFPTVPISGRAVKTSFTTETGLCIPANWRVFIGLDALSTMFSECDSNFSLERWLNKDVGSKWEIYSFGAGARDCVGADLGRCFVKLVLNEMIRMFNWRLSDNLSAITKHYLILQIEPIVQHNTASE